MMKRFNVLIADNDYITKMLLHNQNHPNQNVFFVDNLQSAVEISKLYPIDVLILNLEIPHAESFGILNHFKIYSKVTPEIIVISHSYNNYFLSNKELTILNKPLNVNVVRNLIDDTCAKLDDKNMMYQNVG